MEVLDDCEGRDHIEVILRERNGEVTIPLMIEANPARPSELENSLGVVAEAVPRIAKVIDGTALEAKSLKNGGLVHRAAPDIEQTQAFEVWEVPGHGRHDRA
jgi:hypothetical protein